MFVDNSMQIFSKKLDFTNNKVVKKPDNIDYFGQFFDEALKLIEKTDDMQKNAEQKQINFITGKSDDIIGLVMAETRANSAVQFTSQITNKILTAYQEIIRMPM